MKPIDMGKNINDKTWAIRHLKINMDIAKIGTGVIVIS